MKDIWIVFGLLFVALAGKANAMPLHSLDVIYPMRLTLEELARSSEGFASEQEKSAARLEKVQDVTWRTQHVRALLDSSVQFAEIPSGLFLMGASSDFQALNYDPQKYWSDAPSRLIHIGKENTKIMIQRTSVTQLLWYLVMGTNPSVFRRSQDCPEDHITIGEVSLCPLHPVVNVSWNDIAEQNESGEYKEGTFLKILKEVYGIEARLPTDAERERATRGADSDKSHFNSPYYFGSVGHDNANLSAHAWWAGNSDGHPHRVGEKGWNTLGLADMIGNVSEWVSDKDGKEQYRYQTYLHFLQDEVPLLINPQGPDSGAGRLYRGGSYNSNPNPLRTAAIGRAIDWYRSCELGFRVVMEVQVQNQ